MTLEEVRMYKIKKVINTLNRSKIAGISIDYEKLIKEVGILFGTSRRTSMDYIDYAINETNCLIVKIGFEKEIISKSIAYDQIINRNSNEWRDMLEKELKLIRTA